MGSRKRSKPNPQSEAESQLVAPDKKPGVDSQTDSLHSIPVPSKAQDVKGGLRDSSAAGPETALPSSTSTKWYGSWPHGIKSNPVTQVARESISANHDVVSSTPSKATQSPVTSLKSPALHRLSRSIKNSATSLALPATTSKINITSTFPEFADGSRKLSVQPTPNSEPPEVPDSNTDQIKSQVPEKDEQGIPQQDGADSRTPAATPIKDEDEIASPERAIDNTPRWISWFSRPATAAVQSSAILENTAAKVEPTQKHSDSQHVAPDNSKPSPVLEEMPPSSSSDPTIPVATRTESKYRSWLGLLNGIAAQSKSNVSLDDSNPAKELADHPKSQEPNAGSEQKSEPSPSDSFKVVQPATLSKSTGWAFWSQDRSQDRSSAKEPDTGKLVRAESPSQSVPENAVILDAQKTLPKTKKRERPQSLDISNEVESAEFSKGQTAKGKTPKDAAVDPSTKSTEHPNVQAKKQPANLVLPSFRKTYKPVTKPSLIQQLGRLLQYNSLPDTKHVNLLQDPPRIKNALAIGVHGYFPAPLIRSVIGQPTGTSLRFANGAATAIQRWTQNRGYQCEVEKIALEGEGKVAERIELLWKLLLNWVGKIRKADFIMIACHSQGVPVAMMLVAKLIEFGCVNNTRIGVCALAGINLGPFSDYKSRWIGGSTAELFDFARLDSQVSKEYEAALDIALKSGVRVAYIGSIDDQLVSLESSTFGTINHPYIFRAVFVDGRVHAPDFLTHLVGFALKLRNLGISDHGLIRELSSSLAGSLYSGEGHSRIYDEDSVYDVAVEYALETTSVGSLPLRSLRQAVPSSQNPYILPFAMRGILEEKFVHTDLYDESMELLKQFDDWKPTSKVLKDVKFRLEGVRSKL